MSMPPIDIRWGGGQWPRQRRRSVLPTVRTALDLAGYGIQTLGVEYREPKTAIVWCAGDALEDDGGADTGNAREFELYLRMKALKHHKIARWLPTIMTTAVHEVFHCIREEYADDTASLEGRVADEGIANFGEYLVARTLLTRAEFASDYPKAIFTPPKPTVAGLRAALACDIDFLDACGSGVSYDQELERLEDAWLTPTMPKMLSAGETLGVGAVSELFMAGHSLPLIMQMPSRRILGVE